ncbi:efflux RND transporter periplasmic adaptor subunit [Sphingobacterium sp. Mn56C]|uniref:efflux RND transporter periplasmic adaptor subunit n=1 Tax=Sphingobacterium sp. Mn56C TaxID=3395261 RepID=UPI003BD1F18E
MMKVFFCGSLWGCLLLVAACTATSKDTKVKDTAKVIPVTSLVTKDTSIAKEYIADIQSQRNVELRSRLTGFLEHIYVDEGAFVRKNQVLFSINDEEYKAQLAQAQAVLDNARAEVKKVELELERTARLVQKNIVSATEQELLSVQLKATVAKVQEAEALLSSARTKLSHTKIRAPFDGRLDRILLKEGSLLTEGALITAISDLDKVNVYYTISESEYLAMASAVDFNPHKFKQQVQLILANGQLYPYPGVAELVESEFETRTGSIALRAKFDNPQALLKHGSSGRIAVPEQVGKLTLVHQKSVFEIQDKAYVYVVKGNTVKMTPFKHGPRVGHYYVVEEGLPADVKVVYEGVRSLRDGMTITPKFVDNI